MKLTRNTKQKKIIEDAISSYSSFFTADDLLKKVQKTDDSIGIATIYRFLKEKKNDDEIHSYNCRRKTVYSTQKNNHCHFICTKCGKITHFNIKDIDFIEKNIDGKVCHFQVDIYGLCKDCK